MISRQNYNYVHIFPLCRPVLVENMAALRERAVNLQLLEKATRQCCQGTLIPGSQEQFFKVRETDGRVQENFRNSFQPYMARARLTSFSSSSRQQSASSAPATKRRKRNTTVLFFKRDTWTHKFFCPADKGQMAVRSRSFKIQLQQAGQGRKKICFNSKANERKSRRS